MFSKMKRQCDKCSPHGGRRERKAITMNSIYLVPSKEFVSGNKGNNHGYYLQTDRNSLECTFYRGYTLVELP